MTKKINSDESNQAEFNAETTSPSDETLEGQSHGFRNILFLGFFLLIAGAGSYYLTPLLLPYLSESPAIKQDEIISVATPKLKTEIVVAEDHQPAPQPEIPADNSNLSTNSQEAVPVSIPLDEILPAEQPKAQVLPETSLPLYETPSVDMRPQPVAPQSSTQGILLMKVIQLYETFQKKGQCRPLLEELIAFSERHPAIQNSVNELLTICLENPMSEQIQTAFSKNKKRAILRILQNNNTPMMSYIKALPYLIFDIRKKEAFTKTPMDTLYRLQAAVEANNFAQIIELINQLPDNVQPALYDLKQSAIHENTVDQVLQNLIQTLATGGNNE